MATPRLLSSSLLTAFLVFLAYLAAAKLGFAFAFVNSSVSPVWPPTGVALAALIILGPRLWPAILLGAFTANYTLTGSALSSSLIGLGNTSEALLGSFLVTRYANGVRVFERAHDTWKFALYAGMGSTMVSATIGTLALSIAGHADWSASARLWFTWWLGDLGGALIVTPVLIEWYRHPGLAWKRERGLELCALLLAMLLTGQIVFGPALPVSSHRYPIQFLVVPILVWCAFRFSVRMTVSLAFLLAGMAIWGTVHGIGPFARASPNESLLLVQAFLAVITPMALALAAGSGERARVEAALREAHAELNARVQDRTAELADANVVLREEIHARKRAEEAMRREQEFSRCLIHSSPEGVLAFDLNYRYTVWNPGMERISGIKQQEVIGRQAFDVFPFLKETGEDQYFYAALAGHISVARDRPYTIPETGRQGVFEGYYSPIRSEAGRIIGGLAIIRDVTERQRIIEALEESQARFRSVIESANDAIVVADGEGRIILWNTAAESMFGYPEGEVLDQPLTLLMPERLRDAHTKGLTRLQAGHPSRILGKTVIVDGLRKDGSEFPIELAVTRWQSRGMTFYSGIIRDITERRQSELALQQAREELERRVLERTQQLALANTALQEKIHDLERFHDVVVGRELKMIELEEELKRLKAQRAQQSEQAR